MATKYNPKDVLIARRANKYGMKNSLRIVIEARTAGVPLSLAFAMVEQESTDGSNVFGHDPVTNTVKGGKVTKARYLEYKRQRKAGKGMQGVGPLQLTWYAFQDQADALGGCWIPKYNIRVGFRHLASLIAAKGQYAGIRSYNGTGPAAERYVREVLVKQKKWHKRLA